MYTGIRQMCALSVFFGAALSIMPEGNVKRVAEISCTASLILAVISPFKTIDLESYALETARVHALETQILSQAADTRERLNRLVIETEYETYIMDKAAQLGITDLEADLEAQWSMEGVWLPWRVELRASCSEEEKARLTQILQSELGITEERQQWNHGQ